MAVRGGMHWSASLAGGGVVVGDHDVVAGLVSSCRPWSRLRLRVAVVLG